MEDNVQGKICWFEETAIRGIEVPERFTFPFYYEPHPLTQIAVAELQHYLETQHATDHNFGLQAEQEGMVIGKMFGVLVIQDTNGRLGYLCGFSGKLAGSNDHPRFVPPVFDMLVENSFFLQGIEIINTINGRIEEIGSDTQYQRLKQDIETIAAQSVTEVASFKKQLKTNKEHRSKLREREKAILDQPSYTLLEADLIRQSLYDKHQLKVLTGNWQQQLDEAQKALAAYEAEIEQLKNERKERSAALQQQIFEQYAFLNKEGQSKSLQDIFSQTPFGVPPAGAGECATPKLLQFAFLHGYQPIAMAEFWWGASPKSDIRQHKQFYPACAGKCKPILAHMLDGILIEENPFLRTLETGHALEIVYQDDWLVVVNKPAGLRSVPGVAIHDSVYTRLQHVLEDTEPLMVHRLDMDTSGLLVVAKTPEVHKYLQQQFLKRTVSKRYRALLSKVIEQPEGEIGLPLGPDLLNRPRQLVCFETGKKSVTKWKVVEAMDGKTKVDFWPLTGRTHQLRMHAAHELGLNAPIVGDDLYGTAAERMYLHAAYLEFTHPKTRQKVCFEVREDF